MARNKNGSTSAQPEAQVGEAPKGDEFDMGDDPANAPLVADAPVTGSVPEMQPDAPAPAEVLVQRYRVTQGGPIVVNGCRTEMRTGKIIDARNYDLDRLRTQNIRMEPVTE